MSATARSALGWYRPSVGVPGTLAAVAVFLWLAFFSSVQFGEFNPAHSCYLHPSCQLCDRVFGCIDRQAQQPKAEGILQHHAEDAEAHPVLGDLLCDC